MREKDKTEQALVKAGQSVVPPRTRPNLLDVPVEGLTPPEKKEIQKQVVAEQIRLDVRTKEAEGRFVASARDMARDVELVRALEQSTRGDYTVDGQYQTASGQTTVKVRRNTNTAMIIIAIVIGVIVLLVLTR